VATHVVPEHAVPIVPVVGHAAQTPPHALNPLLQVSVQLVPSHPVVPLGSTGQAVQSAPQVATALLEEQTPEQRWKPVWQAHACEVMSQVSFAPHWVSNAQPALHTPVERSQKARPGHGADRQSGDAWQTEPEQT
jgi:hypothetical protein